MNCNEKHSQIVGIFPLFVIYCILFMVQMIVVHYSKSKIMNFSIRIQPGQLSIVQNEMGVTYEFSIDLNLLHGNPVLKI